MLFQQREGSYQTLLKVAQKIVKERHISLTSPILAEDLWERDPLFSPLKGKELKILTKRIVKQSDLELTLSLTPISEMGEVQVLQLIRTFLLLAVSRGDMKRTPLDNSIREVQGFAFVSKTNK